MSRNTQELTDFMNNFQDRLNLSVTAFQVVARSAAATAGLDDMVTMADLKEALAALEAITAKASAGPTGVNRSAALMLNLVSFLCFTLGEEFTMNVMIAERPKSNPNMN